MLLLSGTHIHFAVLLPLSSPQHGDISLSLAFPLPPSPERLMDGARLWSCCQQCDRSSLAEEREQSEPSAGSPQSQHKSIAIELHTLRGTVMASLISSSPFHSHTDHFKDGKEKKSWNVLEQTLCYIYKEREGQGYRIQMEDSASTFVSRTFSTIKNAWTNFDI